MTRVRFAPSPTGFIHLGNLRTALFNWLYAKGRGGEFVLRLDDTDAARSQTRFADAIVRDLGWVGIEADLQVRQSDRFDLYEAAAARLRGAGLLYPCYESPDELERKRRLRLARRLPPVYGRDALKLTAEDRERLEDEGQRPHWRFLLPNFDTDPFSPRATPIGWEDLCRGLQEVDLASLSDPVLIREDGSWLYTLPSVVDDGDLGITEIIRGDDHVTNTGVQLALFDALDLQRPRFGHHNLLTDAAGDGLSKRTGSLSIASLRQAGHEPLAVATAAVRIGTSQDVKAPADLAQLAEAFDPSAASRSAARFDDAMLQSLDRDVLQQMTFDEARPRLEELGIEGSDAEAFWLAVRPNLERFDEAADWWRIVREGPDPSGAPLDETERDFVREAFDHLPPAPWDGTSWKRWTDSVKAATGRKGRALFMPLRAALTGRRAGPELADLLPLIGPDEAARRRP